MKGNLGWRKLINLVRHLPPNSATVIARSGPAAAWTVDQHLLASTVDLLAAANWQRAGNRNATKPKPLPRPGQVTRRPVAKKLRARSMQEMDRIMSDWSTSKPDRTQTTVVYQ